MPGGIYPPLDVILSWNPNYVDPETRGSLVQILLFALLGLCYVFVILRVYATAVRSKTFGWDDGLIVFTLPFLTGMTTCIYLGVTKYGWDKHTWDIPLSSAYSARKVGLATEHCHNFGMCLTKVSILLLYRRITLRISQKMLWTIHFLIGTFVASTLFITLGLFFGCQPFKAYWLSVNPIWATSHQGEYRCWDEGAFTVAICALHVVQEFIIYFLPMPIIVKLKISLREKLALLSIFGIGFFLCVCGILRLISVIKTFYYTYDVSWSSYEAYLWAGIEAHVAVIIASIPALNHFFRSIVKENASFHTRSQSRDRRGTSGYSHTGSKSKTRFDDEAQIELRRVGSIHDVHEIYLENSTKGEASDRLHDWSAIQSPANVYVPKRASIDWTQSWLNDESLSEDEFRDDHRISPAPAI